MLVASNSIIFLLIFQVFSTGHAEEDYQRLALQLHNEFRATHQAGPLMFNDTLNLIAGQCAQYYADKGYCDMTCPFRSNTTEQSCYWEWRVLSNETIVQSSIDAWSSEECKHDYKREGLPGTRNFSLMAWASSQELECQE
ncbi:unnamed protein product [Orchesella dallaii]|uniref:SCP domain-containing protein n=1 Tax=Orchesella dallaii TaxID=48710 RepID=A0ABP1RIM8_9HEXA